MIQVPDTLPVPKHHTMSTVDSSKIQTFQDCPRKFFFRYILGLQSEGANVHLDFGSAWHEAMEYLLLNGYSEQSVEGAFKAFLEIYREAFPDDIIDKDNAPKNPEYAWKALHQYVKQYESDNFEVLYTETAGLVPIREDRDLAVKLDSILLDKSSGEIVSMEHKTTGRNSSTWREKWAYMLQVESYTHLLYSIYPPERVGKVIINGSVFTKTRTWDGLRIPIYKSQDQMNAFLWNVNHWIDQIEYNFRRLAETKVDDRVMEAFPINCASCSKYGCDMDGICSAFPNPLQFAEDPPVGYEVDFWDPLRKEEEADNVIEKDESGEVSIRKKSEEEKEEDQKKVKQHREEKEEKDDFSYLLPPDEADY